MYPFISVLIHQHEQIGKVFGIVFVLYAFSIALLPSPLNLQRLTYDPRIAENWILVLLIWGIGVFIIALKLFFYKKIVINLPEKEKKLLAIHPLKDIPTSKVVVSIIGMMIILLFMMFMGIAGSSYIHLIMFTAVPYWVIFTRFGTHR